MANSLLRRPAARSTGKHFVKGLTSSNRWSSLALAEGSQEDWLSKLPNDIMLNIVERLDIANAARTSILSRRWRQIPAMLSKICLTVGNYIHDEERSLTCDDVVQANATILEATRSMLQNRTMSLCTIHLLFMQFFLGDGSINIGQTVADAIETDKVGSAELSLLAKNDLWGCTDDDLFNNGRQLRSFVDACPNTLSGLTRLKLESLVIFPSVFTKICNICKRLDFLHLYNIEMGDPCLLQVQHPQLREFEIVKCSFERVDLNCLPKLTTLTLSYWASTHDPLSIGDAPLLQTVTMSNTALSWHTMLRLSEVLGKATVSDLHLNFESEKIWVKPEGPRELWPVFHKLRFVELADIPEECDLAWTLFILEGAPSLKELCLQVLNSCTMRRNEQERKEYAFSEEKKDAGVEWKASAFKHHNLAVLRIFGFQLEEKFVDYVSAVMESAPDLQNIYLYGKPTCVRHKKCRKPKDRYPWAKKQRISVISCLDMDLHPLLRIHFPSVRA